MSTLSPYRSAVSHDFAADGNSNSPEVAETGPLPFISLLEFVSEVYQVSWNRFTLEDSFFMNTHTLNRNKL